MQKYELIFIFCFDFEGENYSSSLKLYVVEKCIKIFSASFDNLFVTDDEPQKSNTPRGIAF